MDSLFGGRPLPSAPQPLGMLDCGAMLPLACMMHWYVSMLFFAPVAGVGGWVWLNTKRIAKRGEPRPEVQAATARRV